MDKLKGRPKKAFPRGTLSDLGISRKQSSRWPKLAAMPQREFDLAIGESVKPTTTKGHSARGRTSAPPNGDATLLQALL
jgi:hypothetical protein